MQNYVEMVAASLQISEKDARKQMDMVKSKYGLTHKEYYKNELHLLSQSELILTARRLQHRKERRAAVFAKLMEETGMNKKEIVETIKAINEKDILHINVFHYEKFQLYRYEDEKLDDVLRDIAYRDRLKETLQEKLVLAEQGNTSYENLEEMWNAYCQVTQKILPDYFLEDYRTRMLISEPELSGDEAGLHQMMVDMEATRMLLRFTFNEYFTFHFWGKSLEEKHGFMNNRQRIQILREINTEQGSNLLNNKGETYRLLAPYYHRKQVYVNTMDDYSAFQSFCKGRKVFVKKPIANAMGKGVEPIHLEKGSNLKELMESLLDENGSFVAEELIQSHRKFKKLNPSSVNTVRLETFYDGRETKFCDAFMRIGQKGAFVDNGGAGGIIVAVDVESGVITSHGCDEQGRVYERHPETGVLFKGYRLPAWKKALALGKEISDKVPGVQFIGWDLVYTNRRKWVIVEGNAKPQIIGNQSSQRKGLKRHFLDVIGYEAADSRG